MPKYLMTVADAADAAGIPPTVAHSVVQWQKIPHVMKIGARTRLFHPCLVDYLKAVQEERARHARKLMCLKITMVTVTDEEKTAREEAEGLEVETNRRFKQVLREVVYA